MSESVYHLAEVVRILDPGGTNGHLRAAGVRGLLGQLPTMDDVQEIVRALPREWAARFSTLVWNEADLPDVHEVLSFDAVKLVEWIWRTRPQQAEVAS